MIKWIWALIPAAAQGWVIFGLFAVITALLGFTVYKIDDAGYNRCEATYKNAAAAQKEEARGEIIDAGKKYEKLESDVIQKAGPDDRVGPRTEFVIDGLPDAGGGE